MVVYKPKNTARDILGLVGGAINLIPGGNMVTELGTSAIVKGIDYALEKDEYDRLEREKTQKSIVSTPDPNENQNEYTSWY